MKYHLMPRSDRRAGSTVTVIFWCGLLSLLLSATPATSFGMMGGGGFAGGGMHGGGGHVGGFVGGRGGVPGARFGGMPGSFSHGQGMPFVHGSFPHRGFAQGSFAHSGQFHGHFHGHFGHFHGPAVFIGGGFFQYPYYYPGYYPGYAYTPYCDPWSPYYYPPYCYY